MSCNWRERLGDGLELVVGFAGVVVRVGCLLEIISNFCFGEEKSKKNKKEPLLNCDSIFFWKNFQKKFTANKEKGKEPVSSWRTCHKLNTHFESFSLVPRFEYKCIAIDPTPCRTSAIFTVPNSKRTMAWVFKAICIWMRDIFLVSKRAKIYHQNSGVKLQLKRQMEPLFLWRFTYFGKCIQRCKTHV